MPAQFLLVFAAPRLTETVRLEVAIFLSQQHQRDIPRSRDERAPDPAANGRRCAITARWKEAVLEPEVIELRRQLPAQTYAACEVAVDGAGFMKEIVGGVMAVLLRSAKETLRTAEILSFISTSGDG